MKWRARGTDVAEDRSFSDVVQDIIRNVQEIVRSEVRLAKAEIGEEAVKAKSSAVLLGAGAVTATYAIFFLLLMIVYGLALVMPTWAAALISRSGISYYRRLHAQGGRKAVQTNPPYSRTYG